MLAVQVLAPGGPVRAGFVAGAAAGVFAVEASAGVRRFTVWVQEAGSTEAECFAVLEQAALTLDVPVIVRAEKPERMVRFERREREVPNA